MEWTLLEHYGPGLLLYFVRAGAFVVGLPLFGVTRDSHILRVVLTCSLGAIFWWVGDKVIVVDGVMQLFAMATVEAVVGLALGLGVRILMALLSTAGEILSHEMGFAMATIVNPATGKNAPVTAQFLEAMGMLLVFQTNLHHDVLRALGMTYKTLPVGGGFDPEPVALRMQAMIGTAIENGLRYAIPTLGIMLLLTSVLVMLARAVPTINLMEFSFGLRSLLGLLASSFFLAEGAPFLENAMRVGVEQLGVLFQAF